MAILLASISAAITLCLYSLNNTDNVINDPLGQMIVAENVLKHHSLSVDNLGPDTLARLNYRVVRSTNGRLYYYFPFGTTMMSLPLVALLDALGWDMLRDEAAAEHIYCAVAASLLILLLFGIARRFVPDVPAVILTSLMWAGTSLSSVGGLAPWAHLTSSCFASVSILLVLRDPAARDPILRSAIGLALFMAYVSRPTMAILSPMVLIFIACHCWRSTVWVAAIVAGLLAVFFSINIHVFGQARPLFYAGDRLGTSTYWTGMFGNLLGPSRGLFVFSPFLLVPLVFVPKIMRSGSRSLLIIALAWPMLHIAVISDFPRWWAGYSFGPRYTMEILPGLFIMLCLAWREARSTSSAVCTASTLSFLGAFAVFVHVVAGMNNPATPAWNGAASTDAYPELALDWRWPQWAATDARNADLAAHRIQLEQRQPP